MIGGTECALIGKWRFLEADLWDRDHPDRLEPVPSASTTADMANSPF